MIGSARSPRSRLAATLLCFFLGWAGAHRIYLGRVGTGLLMALTYGGFGIWWFLDLISIALGIFTDAAGLRLSSWMPAQVDASPQAEELRDTMDRIDLQSADLQGLALGMADKLDRRRYGHSS